MTQEELLANGIPTKFDGTNVLFHVDTLLDKFKNALVREVDIIEQTIEDVTERFVKQSDIVWDWIEEAITPDAIEEKVNLGMTYDEAEKLLEEDKYIALPEWGGFWFRNTKTNLINVFTKDNVITNTPFGEYRDRNDWIVVEASEEQQKQVDEYISSHNTTEDIPVSELPNSTPEELPVWINPTIV